ncbi:hypothetical protein ACQ4PT_017369 [Festuca glaucescens]
MTVDEASTGDAGGDLAIPPPGWIGEARDPAPACVGRFWAISESSGEGSDGEDDEEASASSQFSLRYVCRSPSPVSGRDLQVSSSVSQRAARRARRQLLQKEAAIFFASPVISSSENVSVDLDVKNQKKLKQVTRPVLEPSSYPDDGAGGWTVVRRRNRSTAITGPGDAQVHDRPMVLNLRARGPTQGDHRGPMAAELSPKGRRDRMRAYRQAQTAAAPKPNLVAGRAFRHLLGYTWRRKTLISTDESRQPAAAMNRGSGRAPDRGGDGRGRQYQSGGHGRGGGRYSGPNSFTRPRNFVQGESSGSAAWEDHAGDHYQENAGDGAGYGNHGGFGQGGFGSFHRGSGYGFHARRFNNQYHRQGTYQQRNQASAGVAMYGYANEALMFFEVPFRGTYKPKVENAKLAKVTIQGEAMTISEIVEQLKWIVPSENFQWEVTHFHNNVYKVKFPSKNEVQRMKKFRTYPVPNRETDMEFEEWSAMEEPTFMLPEVWLRVTGIPSDVRNDYIALWALGSLFGKTMEVDMAFTRKTKILRLRIGCMDASLIPETSDVYISRGFFRLAFQVEQKNLDAEVDMAGDLHNDGNDNGGNGGNEEDRRNEHSKDEVTHMEVEQTLNPGANQGQVGDNSTNFKQNELMVTFGTLPPSPIKNDVSLPCVFTAKSGSVIPLEETGKNLGENRAQNGILQQFSSQAQKDRNGADFEEDLLLDQVPIIGGRVSASDAMPAQADHAAVADPTASPARVQGGLYVGYQVEEARQPVGATRSPRGAPDAGSSAATLCELHAGSSVPANAEAFSVTEFGEKLDGAPGGHIMDETNVVTMALDGAANVFQMRSPKSASMPTEEEVIAFGGIALTMAHSSARL